MDCITEVCKKMYEEAVAPEQQPLSEKIPCLLPAFHKLAEVGPRLSKIGLPEEQLALLIVSLNYMKHRYHKKNESTELLEVAKEVEKVLPILDETTFLKTMACNKLWMSYVKQVSKGPNFVNT